MVETYLRQWEMLRVIPPLPRKMAVSTLAGKLKDKGFTVGMRTLQRDLNTLSRTLPLVSDGAKPAGWSWSEKRIFDIPGMDAQTALTFVLVERFLTPIMPSQSLAYLQAHFARAHEVLEGVSNTSLRDWTAKVRVCPEG